MPCLSFVSFEQTLRTLSGIFFPTHVVAGSFRRAPLKRLARFLDAAPHGLASAVAPSRTHLHPHPASERGSSHHAPPQSGRRLAPSASHMLCCRRWTRLLGAVLGQPGPAGQSRCRRRRHRPALGLVPPRAASLRPKRRRSCGPRPPRASGASPTSVWPTAPGGSVAMGTHRALIAAASPASHWVVPGPKA